MRMLMLRVALKLRRLMFEAMVELPRSGPMPPAASIASVMARRRIW
jgi:hypothetical protein